MYFTMWSGVVAAAGFPLVLVVLEVDPAFLNDAAVPFGTRRPTFVEIGKRSVDLVPVVFRIPTQFAIRRSGS